VFLFQPKLAKRRAYWADAPVAGGIAAFGADGGCSALAAGFGDCAEGASGGVADWAFAVAKPSNEPGAAGVMGMVRVCTVAGSSRSFR
jgi:hypothetical protein